MNPATGTIAGMIIGAAYFAMAERSVPKASNCVYLAPWTTDLFAWLAGAWLVYRGYQHDDPVITLIGSAVASTHVAQFAAHKTLTHRVVTN